MTQGFLFGISQGFAYFPYIGEIPRYFNKKRGLAVGLAVSGTGIGALAFAPLTQLMIDRLSVWWALRLTGCIQLIFGSLCAFLLRPRGKKIRRKGKILDFTYFRDRQFTFMWLAQFFAMFGFFLPAMYGSTYAATLGLTQDQGAIVVGLTNFGSTLGRVLVGLASDRLGHFNAFATCAVLASFCLLLIWPFAKSYGSLIFFGLFFSFNSGGFISLASTCLAEVVGLTAISSAIGMLYWGGFIPDLIAPPIAALLISTNADGTQSYLGLQMFAGTTMAVAAGFMWWVRMERASWKVAVKV